MKKLYAQIVVTAAIVMASCVTPPKPPTPQPPPTSVYAQSNFSVYDEAGAPVTDANCVLRFDRAEGEAPIAVASIEEGFRQSFKYQIPPVHEGWGGQVDCTSPSYEKLSQRVVPIIGENAALIMKSGHHYAGQSGWLTIGNWNGKGSFINQGKAWRYAGFTSFPYLQKFCNGENIGPQVDQAISLGAQVFRTLGMYNGGLGTFTVARDDPGRFDSCTIGYLRYMAARLVRVELVVFADAQNVMSDSSRQRQWFDHVRVLVDPEWNVLGELCNECEKNGVEVADFNRPVGNRVLWSHGSGLGGGTPAMPAWDYVTYHDQRDSEYPRKNECREYMDNSGSPSRGVPCVPDEPMGASEIDQPGKRAGAINGDPSKAVRDFGQMGANFGLQAVGGLFHSDGGLSGQLLGTVQAQLATAFYIGLNFAPPDAFTYTYKRGDNCGDCNGIGGMWLTQRDLPDTAGTLRTFQRDNGGEGWAVEISRAGGQPTARAGARITDQPFPGLIHMRLP